MSDNLPTTTTTTIRGGVRDTRALPVLGSSAPDAIALGRHLPTERKMRYGGDQHVLVFGPNGKGKGTRILMPNLLQMQGSSIVVVDPKGELAAVTAPYRRTLGRVVILNPFAVLTNRRGYDDLESEGFNPLAALDPEADSFNSQAAALADAMVTVEGTDPHWTQSARALIAALIMFEVIEARKEDVAPTLAHVREMLCAPVQPPDDAKDLPGKGLPATARAMMESRHAGLRNKAAQFTDWTREVQSIASAAKIQTEPFDDPEIADDLARGTFDFGDLKREPTTVYLILPPDMMARHSKWLRLVLTAAIHGVMSPRGRGAPKVLFMLDEFFALGHLEIISTVWALARGYGVQMMPILQDLPQLKKLYADMWETFIGMAGAVASFAPNDMTSADWLSKRMGETTLPIMSYSEGSNTNERGETTTSANRSHSSVKVPMMLAHQLFGLPEGWMIVTLDGLSDAVIVEAKGYYRLRLLDALARPNPYHLGGAVAPRSYATLA